MMDRLRWLNEKLFNRNVRHLDPGVRRPDEVERVTGPRHRSAPPTPTRGVGRPGLVLSAEPRLLRFDLPVVPETDVVSGRTRSRTETTRTTQEADHAEVSPTTSAAPADGLLSSAVARSSQLATGFLQGVLTVLAKLPTLLDPVVASLNRATYPRETIAFLLVSLLLLLAAGLRHHDLASELAVPAAVVRQAMPDTRRRRSCEYPACAGWACTAGGLVEAVRAEASVESPRAWLRCHQEESQNDPTA